MSQGIILLLKSPLIGLPMSVLYSSQLISENTNCQSDLFKCRSNHALLLKIVQWLSSAFKIKSKLLFMKRPPWLDLYVPLQPPLLLSSYQHHNGPVSLHELPSLLDHSPLFSPHLVVCLTPSKLNYTLSPLGKPTPIAWYCGCSLGLSHKNNNGLTCLTAPTGDSHSRDYII